MGPGSRRQASWIPFAAFDGATRGRGAERQVLIPCHAGGRGFESRAIERLLLKFPDFVFSELGRPDSHNGIGRLAWGFGPTGKKPTVTGLDVIVSNAGRIRALYTFLDPAEG
jgi:hypothetical protein